MNRKFVQSIMEMHIDALYENGAIYKGVVKDARYDALSVDLVVGGCCEVPATLGMFKVGETVEVVYVPRNTFDVRFQLAYSFLKRRFPSSSFARERKGKVAINGKKMIVILWDEESGLYGCYRPPYRVPERLKSLQAGDEVWCQMADEDSTFVINDIVKL